MTTNAPRPLHRRPRRYVVAGTALATAAGILLTAPASVAAPPTVRSSPEAAAGPAAPRLSLPAPTGPHRVGTTSLHLVDGARSDPLAPTPRRRELMLRLWYPAATSTQPAAAYQTPGVAGILTEFLNSANGTDYPAELFAFATHSRQDAPAAAGPRRPVLLFSPGFGNNAAFNTGLHEELASHGYVVAGIDHTFDAVAVEFPDGRVETQKPGLPVDDLLREVRVADTRFVLGRLTALAAGRNPDAGHRHLPRGLGRALDVTELAAFGYSLGSPTIIEAIDRDRRIKAGAVLDGSPLGQATLDRPMLMMGNPGHRRADDPGWADFYDRLRGPRLHMVIDGTEHADLSDITVFKAAIDLSALFETGPIDGVRALGIQRAYLAAWLDFALRGRHSPLLRAESPRYPEVDFQP
jgi:predicted dienelactone hydrolase